MIVLEGKGLGRSFGGFVAVRDVNISVEQGRIHGLIGPNGAGKSTLIDILSGRSAGKTTGSVMLKGRQIDGLGPGERRQLGMARSFQRTSVFPSLTVREQLQIAARKLGSENNLDEVIQELQLAHLADIEAGTISYGDQRRLDLALALVGRPGLLLLDEPAAGLTARESMRLADHLRGLVKSWGLTVLLVEHDMEVVFSICDRITVMQLGRILAEGTPAEIQADRRVIDAYLGAEE